jgi:hypothetical protein
VSPIPALRGRGQRLIVVEARVTRTAYCRAQAKHCRELAKIVYNPRLEDVLLKLAADFDHEALLAELEEDDALKRGD